MPISLELLKYYASNDEATRFVRQQLEFEVTKRFFKDWLPTSPSSVLEVGAGSGHYTKWLLDQGHRVTSIEPTPELVVMLAELRKKYPSEQLQIIHGDDGQVQNLNEQYDRILLMGPMYHLFDPNQRAKLLSEAQKKLKADGQIFSVFLSRVGFLSYLLKNSPEILTDNPETVGHVIQNGFDPNVNPEGQFRGNFDSLQSIVELHQSAGLNVARFLSLDPLIGPEDSWFNNLDEASKPFWLEVAYHTSSWPEALGSSRTWGFVSS